LLLSLSLPLPCPLFFFTPPAPPEISTLSLHDALPIYGLRDRALPAPLPGRRVHPWAHLADHDLRSRVDGHGRPGEPRDGLDVPRSEEHTSELQSLTNLVCRLLLEKKNTIT